MKLVIDIDELDYETIKVVEGLGGNWRTDIASRNMKAIANGTPLPKGNGELVYREDVCNELRYMDNNGFITRSVNHVIEDIKKGVLTVIEADKAESEEYNE